MSQDQCMAVMEDGTAEISERRVFTVSDSSVSEASLSSTCDLQQTGLVASETDLGQ
jgi:hypothetical protein